MDHSWEVLEAREDDSAVQPRIRAQVGDGDVVPNEIAGFVALQTFLQDTQQSVDLLAESLGGVLVLFWREVAEEMVLALDRPQAGHLEEGPFEHFVVLGRPVREADLVVLVEFVSKVDHDGRRLADVGHVARVVRVRKGRDSPVGIELQVPVFLALRLHDVNRSDVVIQAKDLQQRGHLEPVGGVCGVELDVWRFNANGLRVVLRENVLNHGVSNQRERKSKEPQSKTG